ncbi:hypothetical protein GOP47_0013421 [Adiantum capillus-veneris]|uniref:Uncharacterized protein n=1 Tax=Adiantum capillus-veneris TaxID=13818 RepID=A0A9D4ZFA3_ADICA|nr:hypothetical protein GOP47_0013421 [Adiantum capillus-veneris]
MHAKHRRWNRCVNKAHVQPWDYHTLLPLLEKAVSDSELKDEIAAYDDFTYEGHHDVLSSTLCAGDIFDANPNASTNVEDVDFYLVKCVVAKEKVEKGYLDEWGNAIHRGSYVVQGLYYEQLDVYTFKIDHK